MISRFGFWPLGPMVSERIILGVLAIAGVVFSLVMLVDCLKRPARKFPNPLTKNGEYDRLIWTVVITLSALWFYFLGAIVYFLVVMRDKTEKVEKKD
jgi:heme/copper-type cytochrome/quinol oxidase subunit 2